MIAAACRVIKAMAWHEEPIKFHTSPPSTTHLRDYIARRDGQPSGTQSPTPDGEEVPQSTLVTPTQMGGPHNNSTCTIGTLRMPS